MALSIMDNFFPTVFGLGFQVWNQCVLKSIYVFRWSRFKTINTSTYIALSASDIPVTPRCRHDLTLPSSVLLRRKLRSISPLICHLGAAGNLSAPLLQADVLLLRVIPQQSVRTQPWRNDCVISSQGATFLTALVFEHFCRFILHLLLIIAGSLSNPSHYK